MRTEDKIAASKRMREIFHASPNGRCFKDLVASHDSLSAVVLDMPCSSDSRANILLPYRDAPRRQTERRSGCGACGRKLHSAPGRLRRIRPSGIMTGTAGYAPLDWDEARCR